MDGAITTLAPSASLVYLFYALFMCEQPVRNMPFYFSLKTQAEFIAPFLVSPPMRKYGNYVLLESITFGHIEQENQDL